jgi:hypothetical protein
MAEYAHACTVPKANGVATIRKRRSAVKRRSNKRVTFVPQAGSMEL